MLGSSCIEKKLLQELCLEVLCRELLYGNVC